MRTRQTQADITVSRGPRIERSHRATVEGKYFAVYGQRER
jgi:hypothetical protein